MPDYQSIYFNQAEQYERMVAREDYQGNLWRTLEQIVPFNGKVVVDIGAGAGFPGIPVAAARPDCAVTLVESHQRKAVFLREATRKLPNVRVLAKRAEDVAGEFDWAISRAVSFDDLKGSLRRLASHAALLTGGDPPPAALGFDWYAALLLPWGKQRFLLVSRETAPAA